RPRGTVPGRRRVFADPFPGGAVRAQGPVGRGSEETVSADRARPLLAAERVERRFEGLRAVDGVSIEAVPGRITGLIGPNGAGKSTLLAVLAGTLPAFAGRILLDGADVTRLPAYQRAQRASCAPSSFPPSSRSSRCSRTCWSACPGTAETPWAAPCGGDPTGGRTSVPRSCGPERCWPALG